MSTLIWRYGGKHWRRDLGGGGGCLTEAGEARQCIYTYLIVGEGGGRRVREGGGLAGL